MKKIIHLMPHQLNRAGSKKEENRLLPICVFTGRQADFRIGVIEYQKKKIARDFGPVVSEKVLTSIDNIQKHFFGTKYWAVVMNLNNEIIYRADEADSEKLSAQEGWRQYVAALQTE